MTLSYKDNHALEALARKLRQFENVSGLTAILNIFNEQTQDLEDALYPMYTNRFITTAEGAQLDQIGEILQEFREDESDADYLERLQAKIRVNRSSGAAPDLIKIYKLILPDNDIFFEQYGGGGFILNIGTVETSRVPTYQKFLRLAKSAGINGQLLVTEADLEDTFTLMEGSTLSAQANAAATSFTPVTPSDYTAGDLLTLSPGTSIAEQRVAGAVTSTVTVAALSNTHPVGAAVERTAAAGGFSTLTAQCTAGATTATFGAGHSFAINDVVVFDMGKSIEEVRTVTAFDATTITIAAVSNTHANGSFVVAQPHKGLSDVTLTTYGGQLSGVIT